MSHEHPEALKAEIELRAIMVQHAKLIQKVIQITKKVTALKLHYPTYHRMHSVIYGCDEMQRRLVGELSEAIEEFSRKTK